MAELATGRHPGYRRWVSSSDLVDRVGRVANRSTLRLTHYGRRSGTPYQVTIWFMVEGETVYLGTMKRERQWCHNVAARPEVVLEIDGESFQGRVTTVTDPDESAHVIDLLAAKYWYTRPYVWLARLLGWQVGSAAFRVRLDPR